MCEHPNMISGLRGNAENTVEWFECPDCGYYFEQPTESALNDEEVTE